MTALHDARTDEEKKKAEYSDALWTADSHHEAAEGQATEQFETLKRKAAALRSLREAVSLGYTDFDWMQQDPDLEILKNEPAFHQLLGQLKPQS